MSSNAKQHNQNKFALITIMVKQLLAELRPRYPGARLLAFPANHGVGVRVAFRSVGDRTAEFEFWQIPQSARQPIGDLYSMGVKRKLGKNASSLRGFDRTSTSAFCVTVFDIIESAIDCSDINNECRAESKPTTVERLRVAVTLAGKAFYHGILFSLSDPDSCDVVKLWIQLNMDDLLLMK